MSGGGGEGGCPGWVVEYVEGAPWLPPLCRGGLALESCTSLGGGVVLVTASGCGERVVAALKGGREAELDPSWLTTLVYNPPPPFESSCTSTPAGPLLVEGRVGGSERGFTVAVRSSGGLLHARVSRRAEFDNIEFAVLEYLTRAGYRWAPRHVCTVLFEGYQYMVLTEAVEGEAAASVAVADAAPGRPPGPRLRGLLESIAEAAASLHKLLASCGEAWCEGEPVREQDVTSWLERIRWRARALEELSSKADVQIDPDLIEAVEGLADLAGDLSDGLYSSFKARIHGDLHLYQVIVSGGRVVLTDFEGEPYKAPASRLEKETPERDIAALLRSLDYAAALASRVPTGMDHAPVYAEWLRGAGSVVVDAYLRAAGREGLGLDPPLARRTIAFWLMERASYEAVYEIIAQTGLHGVPLQAAARMVRGSDPLLAILAKE